MEGAQLAATPREGYGMHPNNRKAFLLAPRLDPVIFGQSQPLCPTAKLEWKVKNKDPPHPQKRKRETNQKRGSGGLKGEGLGPPILLWFLGPAAASLEKNDDGGVQGWVALSPSWPRDDPLLGRAMPGRPSPSPQNRPPSLSVNIRRRETGEVAGRCRDLAPCSCSIFF